MFAPEWIAELEKLQDRAPPAAFAEIHSQLTADLGAPPQELRMGAMLADLTALLRERR